MSRPADDRPRPMELQLCDDTGRLHTDPGYDEELVCTGYFVGWGNAYRCTNAIHQPLSSSVARVAALVRDAVRDGGPVPTT